VTNIATPYSKEGIAHRNRQTVPCPRCMEPCGWCSDPRWMHATLKLPGSKKRCGVPGYEPEGKACPLCHGELKVFRSVTYEAIT
jgi:hypothetical protein